MSPDERLPILARYDGKSLLQIAEDVTSGKDDGTGYFWSRESHAASCALAFEVCGYDKIDIPKGVPDELQKVLQRIIQDNNHIRRVNVVVHSLLAVARKASDSNAVYPSSAATFIAGMLVGQELMTLTDERDRICDNLAKARQAKSVKAKTKHEKIIAEFLRIHNLNPTLSRNSIITAMANKRVKSPGGKSIPEWGSSKTLGDICPKLVRQKRN